MHTEFINHISETDRVELHDAMLCKKLFEPIVVSKNTILEQAQRIPQYLYYIVSGYMRLFYNNDNGDEITSHINCPHGFFTSFTEFRNKSKASANVEAITECRLLRITRSDYDQLINESLFWKNYAMRILQDSVTYNEERTKDLATLTGEQRYVKLMQSHPDVILNVPLQYIASFLGIKPESLSRIRRNIIN